MIPNGEKLFTLLIAVAAPTATSPAVTPPAVTPAEQAALPECPAQQLSIRFETTGDGLGALFHPGTSLVVRNLGPQACAVPALPALRFEDAVGAPLAVVRRSPPGTHPGPVLRPVALPAGTQAAGAFRWLGLDDDAAERRCVSPARVTVQVGSTAARQAWSGGKACGVAEKPALFDLAPLRADMPGARNR